ncbi:MAG: chemotaxis protein CheC [Bacillota bacterium]|nr:chemotaxis protein CheC [Bacillota bacterium]
MAISINDLNNLQMDVLREIGNIGAGNAATALAKMMNKRIDMDVPKINVLEFKNVSDILGGAETLVVGILLKVTGDLTGNIMFMLDIESARLLVSILMGEEASKYTDACEFNEIEQSALKEIGNILAGSYLSALSSLTNLLIMPSIPDLAVDMAGAILSVPAIEFGKVGDTVLYIETEFAYGPSVVVGDFFLVPDIDSYETLLKALGVTN